MILKHCNCKIDRSENNNFIEFGNIMNKTKDEN